MKWFHFFLRTCPLDFQIILRINRLHPTSPTSNQDRLALSNIQFEIKRPNLPGIRCRCAWHLIERGR